MMSSSRGRGLGPEVKRNILLGTYVLSKEHYDAYYLRAMKVRRLIKEDFDRAFEKYDLLVAPTTVAVAFSHGERNEDLSGMLTCTGQPGGYPGYVHPRRMVDGLPVGLQLMGPRWRKEPCLGRPMPLSRLQITICAHPYWRYRL